MHFPSRFLAAPAVSALALAAAIGMAAPAAATAAGKYQSAWRSETLHYAVSDRTCTYDDLSSSGQLQLGSSNICRYNIRNRAHRVVGHAGFFCGLISNTEAMCVGALVLQHGTLSTSGETMDGAPAAITGGTGIYQGAVGQWSWTDATGDFVVQLRLPRT